MEFDKEKAAREYADVLREKYSSLNGIRLEDVATWIEEAYIKGFDACQSAMGNPAAEIDQLKAEISRHIATINEYEKWEVIQLKEISKLSETLAETERLANSLKCQAEKLLKG